MAGPRSLSGNSATSDRPDVPHGAGTLVEVLHHWAEKRPDERVFTFLVDGETEEVTLTFRELDRRAQAIAAMLTNLGIRGQRALLLYAPGLEYIAGFLGCLYAGVVAVPAYPPDPSRLERTLPRLVAIAKDARASVVLTSTALLSLADPILAIAAELRALRWLSTDDADLAAAEHWAPLPLGECALAFLQYTSGSTRAPRGAMVSHANLLDNFELLRRLLEFTPGTTASILAAAVSRSWSHREPRDRIRGGHMVLMSPMSFLQRPLCWLWAMSRYRGEIGAAPNFAYDLCVRKTTPEERATFDLTSWRLAPCSAEPFATRPWSGSRPRSSHLDSEGTRCSHRMDWPRRRSSSRPDRVERRCPCDDYWLPDSSTTKSST